jgi:hypothetical protein
MGKIHWMLKMRRIKEVNQTTWSNLKLNSKRKAMEAQRIMEAM